MLSIPPNPHVTKLKVLVLVAVAAAVAAAATTTSATYLETPLDALDGASGDNFGYSAAIDPVSSTSSSTTLVVGAWNRASSRGSAYVFTCTSSMTCTQESELAGLSPAGSLAPAANDQFGASLAVALPWIAVGAPNKKVGSNTAQGAVAVFYCPAPSQCTQQTDVLYEAAGAGSDQFGYALALDEPSGTLFVGSPYTNSSRGAVYVYSCNDTACTLVTGGTNPVVAFDAVSGNRFGTSLAYYGATLVVGSPFTTVGGAANQGAVYLFTCSLGTAPSASSCSYLTTIAGVLGASADQYGVNVALNGQFLVVAASGKTVGSMTKQGMVYVYTVLDSTTGGDIDTSGDGSTPGTSPALLTIPSALSVASAYFGNGLALYGSLVAVGAPQMTVGTHTLQGAAFLFLCTPSNLTCSQTAELTGAPNAAANDHFGRGIALSNTTLAIGAFYHTVGGTNTTQGEAYLYACDVATGLCECALGWTGPTCSLCADGFLFSTNGTECVPCDAECGTCAGSMGNCTSCATGYFSSAAFTCSPCDAACATCTVEATSCVLWANGHYADSTNTTCANGFAALPSCNACTSGFYAGQYNSSTTSDVSCWPCDDPCATCTLTGSTCSTCNATGSAPYVQAGLCVSACSADGPTPYLQGSTCVSTCPVLVQSGQCVSSCASPYLFTLNATFCVDTCPAPDVYLNGSACVTQCAFYNDSSLTCVDGCASNQYLQAGTTQCTTCSAPCRTCSGSGSSNCTACVAGSAAPYLQQGTCVAACSGATPLLAADGTTCIPACNGSTPFIQDSTCVAACSAPTPLYEGQTCVATCTNSTQYADPATQTCLPCATNCATCATNATHCLSCAASLYLQTGTCVASCGAQFYLDGGAVCSPCSASCGSCTGPLSSQCTSCSPASATYLTGSTCVAAGACPAGTFANTADQHCDACNDPACVACTAASYGSCTSCGAPSPLVFQGTCTATCPSGSYESNNAACLACDPSCTTCSSGGSTHCTSCTGLDTFLSGSSCVAASNCPAVTYADAPSSTCIACSSACTSCANNATTCTACASNSGVPMRLYQGACYVLCPDGTSAATSGSGVAICQPNVATTIYYYAPSLFAAAAATGASIDVQLNLFAVNSSSSSSSSRRRDSTPLAFDSVTMQLCTNAPLFFALIPTSDVQTALLGVNIISINGSQLSTDWANCTTHAVYTGFNVSSPANAIVSPSGCGGSVDPNWSFTIAGLGQVSCQPTTCSAVNDTVAHIVWPAAPVGSAPVNGSCFAGYGGSPTRTCTVGGWQSQAGQCVLCPANCAACSLGSVLACNDCQEGYELDSDSGLCVVPSVVATSSVYYLLGVTLAVGLVVDLAAAYKYRGRYNQDKSRSLRSAYTWTILARLPMLFAGIFDTVSDAFFIQVLNLAPDSQAYYAAALAFTIAPYAINLLVALVVGIVKAVETTDSLEGKLWFAMVLFTFFTGDVVSAITLSQSLLTLQSGKAPAESRVDAYAQVFGTHRAVLAAVGLFAVQFLLKDMPHLVIQASFLAVRGTTNPIVILALAATILTTAVGFFSFIFFTLIPLAKPSEVKLGRVGENGAHANELSLYTPVQKY